MIVCGCVQGEFLETSLEDQELFGLSSMALEQVACQGLACVVHMNLQVLYNNQYHPVVLSVIAGSIITEEHAL